MKKLLGLITALFIGLASLNAMSYEEARDRARFLTDKMAYELNLNEQQYNDAYEINLDYLMNIRTASDASSVYLEYRNADLRHIFYDWQYALFEAATYFFRPVLWRAGAWFLPVYTIYTPGHFYYSPPRVYHVYRGGHFHHGPGFSVSFYAHRRPAWHGGLRGESRGPVAGRPAPPHRPVPHPGRGGTGFRFEPVDRPSRPGQRPQNGKGNGFHFTPVGQPGRPTRPGNGNSRPERSASRTERPTSRPASTTRRPARQDAQRTTNRLRMNSRYNRPSSTRTTVNRAPARQRQSTAKTQVRQQVRQSSARPAVSRTARPATQRHSTAPQRRAAARQ